MSWYPAPDERGKPGVAVVFADGHVKTMHVTRDSDDASEEDLDFVAHARQDLQRLLDARLGAPMPTDEEVDAIAARSERASPGPWDAFLEEEPGMAGDSMIAIPGGDFEPDMYLWFGSDLAPSDDMLLVAEARQDIPRLLAELRSARDIAQR